MTFGFSIEDRAIASPDDFIQDILSQNPLEEMFSEVKTLPRFLGLGFDGKTPVLASNKINHARTHLELMGMLEKNKVFLFVEKIDRVDPIEENEILEPEVPVKKGRGRPRKNPVSQNDHKDSVKQTN